MNVERKTVPVSAFVRLDERPTVEIQQVEHLIIDGVTEKTSYLPLVRVAPDELTAEMRALLETLGMAGLHACEHDLAESSAALTQAQADLTTERQVTAQLRGELEDLQAEQEAPARRDRRDGAPAGGTGRAGDGPDRATARRL